MTGHAERSPLHPASAWPLYVGMAVAAGAAVVASVSTLAALAAAAGWQGWTPWLLPASLDVGGAVGVWCWLRPGAPVKARDFGRWVALTCVAGSLVGNAAGHLIESKYLTPDARLIVIVGAVPAAVLAALAHLAVLLTTTDPEPIGTAPADQGTPSGAPPIVAGSDPGDGPDPATRPEPDPIGQSTQSDAPDRTRPSRPARTRSGRRSSTNRPTRSDDDLRIELAAAIKNGALDLQPSAEAIASQLHIGLKRARALREERRQANSETSEPLDESEPARD